jgi:hypothetical protein
MSNGQSPIKKEKNEKNGKKHLTKKRYKKKWTQNLILNTYRSMSWTKEEC